MKQKKNTATREQKNWCSVEKKTEEKRTKEKIAFSVPFTADRFPLLFLYLTLTLGEKVSVSGSSGVRARAIEFKKENAVIVQSRRK